jgi:hypothetical protein
VKIFIREINSNPVAMYLHEILSWQKKIVETELLLLIFSFITAKRKVETAFRKGLRGKRGDATETLKDIGFYN